jgi:hypothetical protein
MRRQLLKALLLTLILTTSAWSQVSRGTILGTVKDPSGAVIPGVSVTVVNEGTNLSRSLITDETGSFNAELLPVGKYRIEAELAGFRKEVRTGIELHVDQKARADMTLQVGDVAEVVQVDAAAPLVQTEDASLASTMDNRKIIELPLNGRDIAQLAYLIPGAFAPRQGSSLGGRGGFSIAGQTENTNQLMLDGVNNNGGGTHEISARVNVDAIQEFKIQTNTYGAQYGRFAGAQVDAVTKSGTNEYHGNLYYFHRNDNLDARNAFDPWPLDKKPEFKRHQYGATIGGPIQKNKTFFFAGYQGQRQYKLNTKTGTLPLSEYWDGDFSRSGRTITDPVTRQPFQGNRIPANRISQQALQYRQFFPLATDTSKAVGNYTALQPAPDNYHLVNARVDHTINTKQSIFASYTNYNNDLIEYPIAGNPTIPDFAVDGHIYSQLFALSHVYTITPTFINEVRLGFNRLIRVRDPLTYKDRYVNQELGIKGTIADQFPMTRGVPYVDITGMERIGDNTNIPQHNYNQAYTLVDNMSLQRGPHALKFGVDYYKKGQNTIFITNPRGRLNFAGTITGYGFADFLLGLPSRTERNIPGNCERCGIDFHTWISSMNAFIQDDWKVNSRLTLNLGVRYELNWPFQEKYNKLMNFDPVTATLLRADHLKSPLYNMDKNNFAPRIGVAFRPFDDTKTVVRGGFGVFYGVDSLCNCSYYSINPPNFYNEAYTPDATTPLTLTDPFPAARQSTALSIFGSPKDYPNYYYTNWSVSVQRELPGDFVVETIYEGKKGMRLYQSRNINQAVPGAGSLLSRRPYQQWETITWQDAIGMSIYHGGTLKVEKRFSHGLSLLSSYTYGKMIDDAGNPQNSYDLHAERGLSDFHNKHRYTASSVIELPFGDGRRFLSGSTGVARSLLSGWEVSTIFIARSGQPFTPIYTNDNSGTGQFRDRPNLVADPQIDNPGPQGWFNVAAFQNPGAGKFGNAGKGSLIGPGMWSADTSLIKNTRIREGKNLQFRAEFFNVLNHTNLDAPNVQVNSANFGRIFSAQDSRQIQFGMKLFY